MRLLVVGGGGREHALAWKLSQSPVCEQIYVAPGNAGIAQVAECVPIGAKELPALERFAREQRIDLVVVGPESPLIAGLGDALAQAGILCFGPTAQAARIEGSKAFAKQLMKERNIPTAEFAVFSDSQAAKAYLVEHFPTERCVVKADGEALGKGAFVCETLQDALEAVEFLMEARGLGEAGSTVVIEQRLYGQEASVLAFTDGQTVLSLPPVRDYKRALDGDRGPNTGGMGCFTPVPDLPPAPLPVVAESILQPAVRALSERGTPYRGVLYAGLLFQAGQPYVLEFNCRFGDPETQVLMPLLETDLVPIMVAVAQGRLESQPLRWREGAAVCVVLASGGYPGDYRTGFPIEGLEEAAREPGVLLFHAGTKQAGGRILTAGGRVLNVVGLGQTVAEARQNAYRAVAQIAFEGVHYRTDIAAF